MAEEEVSYEEKKSRYNAAVAQLYRLDTLWQDSQRHSRARKYMEWNLDLDAIWRELSEDTKPDGKEEEEFKQFNKKLMLSGLFSLKSEKAFEIPTANLVMVNQMQVNQTAVIYYILNAKETFLRRLQNKQGKGAAYEDDLDSYMD